MPRRMPPASGRRALAAVAPAQSPHLRENKAFEGQTLISSTPGISQEDHLYIQEIVSNGMSKRLSVERDKNKRLRIRLSDQEFLGVPRDELPLSTGEQNFLSLTLLGG